MATRDDIRTDVDSLTGTDPQLSDAEMNTFIQLRYEQLYDAFLWPRKLRDLTISVTAQLNSTSTTLATATNGDATVTFAGTPITSTYASFWIQIAGDPQRFLINRTSSSEIELEDAEGTAVNWAAATGGSKAWRAFRTIYTLPTTAESLLSLAGDFPIEEMDGGRTELDRIDPDRSASSAHATHWVYTGVNSSNTVEIELWPVPTSNRVYRGQFARRAPTLAATTTIDIPRGVLVYAVAADSLNMLHAKTGDAAYQTLALFYESKAKNVAQEIKPIELERLSLPTTLKRRSGALGGLRGTDFEVDHDLGIL